MVPTPTVKQRQQSFYSGSFTAQQLFTVAIGKPLPRSDETPPDVRPGGFHGATVLSLDKANEAMNKAGRG